MCKERIEETAKKSGATQAEWNAETLLKTDESTYNALPGCCHYDRTANMEEAVTSKNSEHTASTEDHSEHNAETSKNEKMIEGVKLTKYQEATLHSIKKKRGWFSILIQKNY